MSVGSIVQYCRYTSLWKIIHCTIVQVRFLFSNSSDEEVSECGCIEENKPIEELRSEPYTLPQGFVWDTLDISNEKVVCWNLLPQQIVVKWTQLEPLNSQSQQRSVTLLWKLFFVLLSSVGWAIKPVFHKMLSWWQSVPSLKKGSANDSWKH